jgi:copper chaperone
MWYKTYNVIWIVFAFALFGVSEMYAQNASAPAKKVQSQAVRGAKLLLEIEGMSCQRGCADGIDAKLKKTTGILSSRTVFETGRSTVEYDESQIKKQAILDIILSMGFKAKELPQSTSKG